MASTSRLTFCMLRRNQHLKSSFQKLYSSNLLSNMRTITTETVPEKADTIPQEKREKIDLQRPTVTKWKRPLFVQNFFIGKFDVHLLNFPEILNTEQVLQLEKSVVALNEIYKTKVNSHKIEEDQRIPSEVLQEFKDLGLFGRFAPTEYGGLNLTYTEYARLNEAIGLDWSIGTILTIHEIIGIKALSLLGTNEQKEKYLPDLASGKKIATLCYHEPESGSDALSIKTTATLTPDGLNYIVTGVKTWVSNAADADLFLVSAKTAKRAISHEGEALLLFIDRNTPGIKTSHITDNICLRGAGVGYVEFDEVVIPVSNVLGEAGQSIGIFNKLLENLRFGLGSLYIGTLKTFLDHITEHIVHTERMGKSLGSFELVKARLSKIAQKIYSMESITYFTAAIYDSTHEPDCGLESAIMKVYNSEGTLFCLREFMKILGTLGLSRSQQLERFYRDAQGMAILDAPNDIARLFIGLFGIRYTGSVRNVEVEEWRNPFTFPWKTMQFGNRYRRIAQKKFSFNHDIAGHLHPSLLSPGNSLEESLQMFDACTNFILKTYGSKIMEHQLDPCRLANMATNLYVMSAVLARSSRSYCIGLRNNDQEVELVATICREGRREIDLTYESITSGRVMNFDERNIEIGEHVLDLKGYFPEHPLKHNW